MPIWTTYLAYFRTIAYEYDEALFEIGQELDEKVHAKGLIPYFVMRRRGNDAVAPSKVLLDKAKAGEIDWETYKREYLDDLDESVEAFTWMKDIAKESENYHVLFVCYEKNADRCHRTLLANYMVKHFGCDYRGEVSALP